MKVQWINNSSEWINFQTQEAGILQFILTNVIERGGCIQWRFNLHGLDTGLQDILKELPTLDATYNGPVLFVKGGKSQYIRYSIIQIGKSVVNNGI